MMDSATQDLYQQKIEEFVHDEEKIVTCKWLSSKLGISIDNSKMLLQTYVTDHQVKKDSLGISYALMGLLKDDTLSIMVVKGDELNDKKQLFKKLVNQQIYSIQKHKTVDLDAVSMVDYFETHNPSESPILGSVVSKNCVKRTFKARKPLPSIPPPVKGKTALITKNPSKGSEQKDDKEVKTVKETNAVKSKQTSNGIASFFNKGVNESNTKSKQIENSAARNKGEKISIAEKISNLVDSESEGENSSVQLDNGKSKENQKPKPSKKRQRKNKQSDQTTKRRKRIVEPTDSDSDDIFGTDQVDSQEDIIEASEDDEPVWKPVHVLPPKNKKRTLVDCTYTDDDGYIVTRKEWLEEVPSEDEVQQENQQQTDEAQVVPESKSKSEVIKPNKPENNVSDNKRTNGKTKAGAKGKKASTNQPTLMNFFKKN